MAKENQDPGSVSTKQTSKLMQQKSLEKTHHSPNHDSPQTIKLKSSSDLFELLERCQSQRLDDQRCVLPSYFSQVSRTNLHNFKFCGGKFDSKNTWPSQQIYRWYRWYKYFIVFYIKEIRWFFLIDGASGLTTWLKSVLSVFGKTWYKLTLPIKIHSHKVTTFVSSHKELHAWAGSSW